MKGKNKYFKVTLTKTLLTRDQPLFEKKYIFIYIINKCSIKVDLDVQ